MEELIKYLETVIDLRQAKKVKHKMSDIIKFKKQFSHFAVTNKTELFFSLHNFHMNFTNYSYLCCTMYEDGFLVDG